MRFTLTTFLIVCISVTSFSQTYNIKEFGAIADGKTLATGAIQKTIDQCSNDGGGTVLVPAGLYLAGTIELKDNVSLFLSNGAKLIATKEVGQFKLKGKIKDTGSDGTPVFIYAERAKNISIIGQGEIIGQPEYYTEPLNSYDFIAEDFDIAVKAGLKPTGYRWKKPNVSLVFLTKCENVQIENVSLLNSPFWTLHAHWCTRVKISGIYIYSDLEKSVNADGIDIDGCRDVTISDCTVMTADDAICLKTTINEEGYRACENVTVTNCILTSSSCALKLGTESHGDFNHILFSNCVIRNSNRGLGIFIRDGGKVNNVLFSDITIECNRKPVGWWGSGDALTFVVLKRNENSKVGSINNIVVRNVIANVQGTSLIAGLEGTNNTVNNIRMEGLQLFMNPESIPDKRATAALKMANINGACISNSTVRWDTQQVEPKWTSALSVKNTSDFQINQFDGTLPGNGNSKSVVELLNVKKRKLSSH